MCRVSGFPKFQVRVVFFAAILQTLVTGCGGSGGQDREDSSTPAPVTNGSPAVGAPSAGSVPATTSTTIKPGSAAPASTSEPPPRTANTSSPFSPGASIPGTLEGGQPSAILPLTRAPDFKLDKITGGTLSLSSLKGKVVLLDFWATWCEPCRGEFPDFQRLQARYGKDGLVVVGMTESSPDDEAGLVRHSDHITFPLVNTDPLTEAAYGAASSVPRSVLINRRGKVVQQVAGAPNPNAYTYWAPLIEKALQG